MFGAIFADIAPVDLRGRYMGVASTTWSIGIVLGPLLGTVLLDQAGRTALGTACVITGIALFAGQLALAPALRRRTTAQREQHPSVPMRAVPLGSTHLTRSHEPERGNKS